MEKVFCRKAEGSAIGESRAAEGLEEHGKHSCGLKNGATH